MRPAEQRSPQASYTSDATNMLTRAYNTARGEAEYAYDGLRNRVKKLERLVGGAAAHGEVQSGLDPGVEMRYVLDMTRPYDNLLMTEGNGQAERYVWGNELLGAAGEESYFYLQDHLHSPIRLVDGAGARDDETCVYDEFGVQKVQAGVAQWKEDGTGCKNLFGFTGYQMDGVSGLYYAQARYYDPANARMVAEDPIRSGQNWYGYCGGNPVRFWDPLGLELVTPALTPEIINDVISGAVSRLYQAVGQSSRDADLWVEQASRDAQIRVEQASRDAQIWVEQASRDAQIWVEQANRDANSSGGIPPLSEFIRVFAPPQYTRQSDRARMQALEQLADAIDEETRRRILSEIGDAMSQYHLDSWDSRNRTLQRFTNSSPRYSSPY